MIIAILAASDPEPVGLGPLIRDLLAVVFLLLGVFFMFVGAVGVVRLPDLYNRLHAASKCSTLGLMGLLLACVCHMPTLDVISKAVLTIVFIFVATPVGSHILAKAALKDHAPFWREDRGFTRPDQTLER